MRIGLDIGSTTIKAAVLDDTGAIAYTCYERHKSRILESAQKLLAKMRAALPELERAQVAISGSAGLGLAKLCDLPFVQEVYATRLSAEKLLPEADVLIELGGEDAKILFLTGAPDARMNGSCAGGTGAFIDQIATLLKVSPAQLNALAAQKEKLYAIASRCGVFAKSDIQPLLNQGAKVEDIAASIFYCVVNQTVAGLAQGRPIRGNVVYLGGPLTFLSGLRSAFDDVLGTAGTLPENSLYFVAVGAAMQTEKEFSISEIVARIGGYSGGTVFEHTQPLFESEEVYRAFCARHARAKAPQRPLAGYSGRAYLGIDAGSTTVKTALVAEDGALLHSSYRPNSGNPVPLVRDTLLEIYKECPAITLVSVVSTGYGEELIKAAFRADAGVVETVAHFYAARYFCPEVDFIIDIGGQDMKCFQVRDGAISDIFLNEACSSGCGSFLQTFAEALGQDVEGFAKMGLFGDAPVELGSRCTVFMNSSVKQAQKDGASVENISAGLAISVVKNALYKVIRTQNPKELGRHVVVQGGTFLNDAVLCAFEKEMGMEVVRPAIAGLMGAFGAALYGRETARGGANSAVLDESALRALEHSVQTVNCGKCTNNCTLTVNTFTGGRKYLSGNRCERPLATRKGDPALNVYAYKRELLEAYRPVAGRRGKIGLPMGLNMYETLPFWHTLFTALEYEVVVSPPSTRQLYFSGQGSIPSDTVCYPAKLMHGHIRALCGTEGVEKIFYPCMTYNFNEGLSDNQFNCPVVAYYPEVIQASCKEYLEGKTLLMPYVGLHRSKDFVDKLRQTMGGLVRGIAPLKIQQAVKAAFAEYYAYMARIRQRGEEIIAQARAAGRRMIVLCGRPYHVDSEVNHGIDTLLLGHGVAVISEECIARQNGKAETNVLNQWTYHARMYAAAEYAAGQPDMDVVQLVSFGCGLDAVTADEVQAILHRAGRLYTQIKIDEIANLGAVNIRLRSLFAALEQSRAAPQGARMEAI